MLETAMFGSHSRQMSSYEAGSYGLSLLAFCSVALSNLNLVADPPWPLNLQL